MPVHPPVPYRLDAELAPFTTYRIGGPADILLLPESPDEFVRGLLWARQEGLPVTVLGGGANVLISDRGVDGVVLLTGGLRGIQFRDCEVSAEAGVLMDDLCRKAAQQGLAGLQPFGGLPGSLGGAVYMNARCYNRSISDVLLSVQSVDSEGNIRTRLPEECDFRYKHTCFQAGNEWILSARLALSPGGDPAVLTEETLAYRNRREAQGQYRFPNAGCVFKNCYSVGTPSGRIIESCGLKGRIQGRAQVFDGHANFIVNLGDATASEVLALIQTVEAEVEAQTGIRLEREVQLLGRWD